MHASAIAAVKIGESRGVFSAGKVVHKGAAALAAGQKVLRLKLVERFREPKANSRMNRKKPG
jgi:hypothetical protein